MRRPLPDELLGSVWIRSVIHADVPVGLATRVLTGRKFSPALLGVSHAADVALALGMDPMGLLMHHSMLPYATAFMTPAVRARCWAAAMATGRDAHGAGGGLQNACERVERYRYCVACVSEDRRERQVSYWRRTHHLPGVGICPRHHMPLREAPYEIKRPVPWPTALPDDRSRWVRRSARVRPFDLALARKSLLLLSADGPRPGPRPASWYRGRLEELGLVTPKRDISSEALVRWARGILGPARPGMAYNDTDEGLSWLPLMVRPGQGQPVPPLKHLVFESMLEVSVGVQMKLDFKPSGPSGAPVEQLDRQLAAQVAQLIRAHLAAGTRTTLEDLFRAAGCWSRFRHDRAELPRTARAALKFKNSYAWTKAPKDPRRAPKTTKRPEGAEGAEDDHR